MKASDQKKKEGGRGRLQEERGGMTHLSYGEGKPACWEGYLLRKSSGGRET